MQATILMADDSARLYKKCSNGKIPKECPTDRDMDGLASLKVICSLVFGSKNNVYIKASTTPS